MFGIWLDCVIFVFTNLENCYIPLKKGVYLFPLKSDSNNTLFHPIIITRDQEKKKYLYIQHMIGVLAAQNNLKVKNARQPVALD